MSSGLLLALTESMGREIASRLAAKLAPPPLPPALVVAMGEYPASLTSQVFEHHLLGAPLDEGKRCRPDDEFDTVLKRQARSMCEPGGLIGDILRVGLGPPISQQDQLDGLGRLVTGSFSRGHLFYPLRWRGTLERAFAQQGWGDTYQAAWRLLAGPALHFALRQLEPITFDNLYMELYPHLRLETRKGVERALLVRHSPPHVAPPSAPDTRAPTGRMKPWSRRCPRINRAFSSAVCNTVSRVISGLTGRS